MKKTLKSIFLCMIMIAVLLSLAGCGKKEEEKPNKLTATKVNEDDSFFGTYTEKIEITFENNKAKTFEWIMELEDEEMAETIASFYSAPEEESEGLDVKTDGNKLIMTMSAEEFLEEENIDDDSLTFEALKADLESEGYTVE